MTSNQINFQNLRETQRHNKAMEGYYTGSLAETTRHNKKSEEIGAVSAQASLSGATAAVSQANTAALRQSEDARHNMQMETIQGLIAAGQYGQQSAQTKYLNKQTSWFGWNLLSPVVTTAVGALLR